MFSDKRPIFTEERLKYSDEEETRKWLVEMGESTKGISALVHKRDVWCANGAALFLGLSCMAPSWWQAVCVALGVLCAAQFFRDVSLGHMYFRMALDLEIERRRLAARKPELPV